MTESNISNLDIVEYPNSVMADLIKDTESLLQGVNSYDSIIPEYKFKNIKIYGDNKNPCFQANCIFDYLYPKYMKNFDELTDEMKTRAKNTRKRKFTRWISDNFDHDLSNDNTDEIYRAYIKNNVSDKRYYECYVLTEIGMLTAMCSNKTELSRIFKKKLIQFIKNIRDHHILIYDEERVKSNNILKKELEFEKCARRELQVINDSNIQLQEAFNNPNIFGDHERTELTILRKETQKQYYLYAVDWEYVNSRFWVDTKYKKKSKKVSADTIECFDLNDSSDDDTEISKPVVKKICKKNKLDTTGIPHTYGIRNSYDLYYINKHDLNNIEMNADYYFCIKSKEISGFKKKFFKFIEYINIKNVNHYKAMIQIITHGNEYNNANPYQINSDIDQESPRIISNPEGLTPYNDVFITSYSDIHDARNSSFNNLNKHYITDVVK